MAVWDADIHAVQKDIDDFYKDPAKVQQFLTLALNLGYFNALDQGRMTGLIKMAMFEHEYRRIYTELLPKIREAKDVILHIRKALDRIEAVCQHARARRHVESVSAQPDQVNMKDAIFALQGWLATLFADYLGLFGLFHGALRTEWIIRAWAADSWDILQKRKLDRDMMANHDELYQTRLMER